MRITSNSVVAFDYVLKNDAGEIMDESGDEPLTYIHGQGQIVPGLEKALEGQTKGANVNIVIPPKDGYGEKSANKSVRIPKDELPDDMDADVGMALDAVGQDGNTITLWVVTADENGVEVSVDHPLAGVTLHFAVTVKEVRAATKEELAHGHVHGPEGHHHH